MSKSDVVQLSFRIPAEVHNWLLAAAGRSSINDYLLSILDEKMAAAPLSAADTQPSTVVTVRLSEESIQDLVSAISRSLRTESP